MWFLFPGYLGWFSLLPTSVPTSPCRQSTNLLLLCSPETRYIFFFFFSQIVSWNVEYERNHQILSIFRVMITNSVVSTRFCVKCCFVWKTLLFTLVYRWSRQGREWQNNLTPGHTVSECQKQCLNLSTWFPTSWYLASLQYSYPGVVLRSWT